MMSSHMLSFLIFMRASMEKFLWSSQLCAAGLIETSRNALGVWGGSAAHWEGVVLIRNRSASSYRSRMTSEISGFMERKPLHVAPATQELGDSGDGDRGKGTPVLHWQHSLTPVRWDG